MLPLRTHSKGGVLALILGKPFLEKISLEGHCITITVFSMASRELTLFLKIAMIVNLHEAEARYGAESDLGDVR